jgi:hypothetical protein
METVDLTALAEREVALAALAAVRERLSAGGALRLVTRSDPSLLLTSLNVQLRDALHWDARSTPAGWEATVRLAEDVPSADLLMLLKQEHRRLDELLGRALRCLNAGDTAAARPLLHEFAARIRRHAQVENELLGPALGGEGSLDTMLSEHEGLLSELATVEGCLAEGASQAWEIEPFVAMLSGSLAKHEQREEERLFPLWSARLAACRDGERAELQEAVIRALSG